ncbi:efflux RND transporter periplasmic adaptor subunit [Tunicatimonas pelagia]|uniref:efflux RND transporter periplasmic adaptor subunit n=1 Tax=Tunicatimonas pelagia TaxID=931531 RepID=UPI0026667BB6|nr:efflux RND transporter periplasmic adaptor subunit [Tunicatimonas pelagia]WKN46181.1 efflux RND transporter periplasmic adaptor subunit [Tunicatimonas pelagia]
MRKSIQGLLIAVVSVALASTSCTEKAQIITTEEIQNLPVTQILMRDTTLHREYVADIQAIQNVELRARVPGFLERIYVDEGQEVKKGQLLFKINDEEYKAELAKAKANMQNTIAEAKAVELEVDRLRVLVDKNVISKTELDVAQARLEAVNARIAEARSAETNATMRVSYTSIRAPFDGIIDRIPLKTGSLIEHGTLLTTASDISNVFAYFYVSESEYLQYMKMRGNAEANSNEVHLILADGSPYPHMGKIETMEGEFKASTGSIAFRARFPNPEKILKHRATGRISLSSTIENAVIVPQKSVFEIQDKNYVFLVDSLNQVKMKNFVPKTRFSHYYIVESGLKPGDRIVFEGIQNLQEGMQIEPQHVGLDSIIAMTRQEAEVL